jgi:hypothetical protein
VLFTMSTGELLALDLDLIDEAKSYGHNTLLQPPWSPTSPRSPRDELETILPTLIPMLLALPRRLDRIGDAVEASTCSRTNATAPRPARIPAGTLEVADQFSGQGNGLLRSPPLRFPAPYADVHVPDGCRPGRSAQLAYPGRPAGPAVSSPATSAQLVTSRRTKLIPLATSRTAANASDSISARE